MSVDTNLCVRPYERTIITKSYYSQTNNYNFQRRLIMAKNKKQNRSSNKSGKNTNNNDTNNPSNTNNTRQSNNTRNARNESIPDDRPRRDGPGGN